VAGTGATAVVVAGAAAATAAEQVLLWIGAAARQSLQPLQNHAKLRLRLVLQLKKISGGVEAQAEVQAEVKSKTS